MTNRTFEIKFDEGIISGSLNIEFDGTNTQIHIVYIHSTFNSGVPRHPTLEHKDGAWNLISHYSNERGSASKTERNIYCQVVVNKILDIKEEETPRFN